MQYPMPARVTGLPYDIDYNYHISDMDKAYMAIMYPRAIPHESAPEWTLENALTKVGIAREDPVAAQKIRDLATVTRPDGTIDPFQIRNLFSNWAAKAHAPATPPLLTPEPPATSRVIKAFPHNMCGGVKFSRRAKGAKPLPNGAAHAVMSPEVIAEKYSFTAEDHHKDYVRTITFRVVSCPRSAKQFKTILAPTSYQMSLLEQGMKGWSALAAVDFLPAKEDEEAGMTIVFQKYHWAQDTVITVEDDLNVSYIRGNSDVPPYVEYDEELAKNMDMDKDVQEDREDMIESTGWPLIRHNVCFRGIVETEEDGEKASHLVYQTGDRKNEVKVVEMNLRTIKHEVSTLQCPRKKKRPPLSEIDRSLPGTQARGGRRLRLRPLQRGSGECLKQAPGDRPF